MMNTASLAERLRKALAGIVRRDPDPEREWHWMEREERVRREHDDSAAEPVAGLRGMQPYDYGISKRP